MGYQSIAWFPPPFPLHSISSGFLTICMYIFVGLQLAHYFHMFKQILPSFICSNKFFSVLSLFFFLSIRYHLYSWVEIGTVKVKCFVQEYNAMTQPSQSESGALRPPHLPHRPRKQHTHWIQAVGLGYLFLCGIQGFWLLALQKMIESSTSIVLTL